MMLAKKSKDEYGTLSLIHWDCCSSFWLQQLLYKIEMGRGWLYKVYRKSCPYLASN